MKYIRELVKEQDEDLGKVTYPEGGPNLEVPRIATAEEVMSAFPRLRKRDQPIL